MPPISNLYLLFTSFGLTVWVKFQIILIVNVQSISRSEFTAMAFQTADNVITVGNQTPGADRDAVNFEYLGGFKTLILGNGILYPDGSQTQRTGIKIYVEINPTIKGLKVGRGEVFGKGDRASFRTKRLRHKLQIYLKATTLLTEVLKAESY